MDFIPLIAQAWSTFAWFIPLMILIGLLKSPLGKGYIGERLVRLFSHWQLDRQTYQRLHNVTLATPDGTTQIDHVFLSRYGIFVLETKNMSGWIFGSEQQAQWTQKFPKHSYKFQNPLRQNYKHLKALEATLGIAPEHLHSVIAFVGGSTFKTAIPAKVTQGIGFIRYIKSFQQPVFSDAQVATLVRALQTGRRVPTITTQREHEQSFKRRNDPAPERQYPKCSNALLDSYREIWGESGAAIMEEARNFRSVGRCRLFKRRELESCTKYALVNLHM